MNKMIIYRVGFIAAAIIVLAILSSVIVSAAIGGVGLLALGVMGMIGFAGIQALPYFGQVLENKILQARKNEAAKNPIEQLQNFLREKADRVAVFKQAVATIGAQIKSLELMVSDRKKQRPGYDASAQENSIHAMKQAHQAMVVKYQNAEVALSELRTAIQDKEFEWKFSQAGQSAMKALSAASGEELMEQMLADTAFASVTDNFNKVFAELELEAQHLTDTKQLSYDAGMTIDLSSINLTQRVNV